MAYDHVVVKNGQRVRSIEIKKFGAISSAPTTEFREIWDGGEKFGGWDKTPYIPQAASVATEDVGVNVTFEGLDDEGYLQSETVTLNGQTPVTFVNSFTIVYRGFVSNGQAPLGDIWAGSGTFTTGIPANKRVLVPYDDNQTLMLFWTIPKGFYLEGRGFRFTVGEGKDISMRQRLRPPGGVWLTKDFLYLFQNALDYGVKALVKVHQGFDISFEVKGNGIGIPFAGIAEFVLYEYEWLSSINPKNR